MDNGGGFFCESEAHKVSTNMTHHSLVEFCEIID